MEEDVKVLAKLLRSQVQQLIKEREEREERRHANPPVQLQPQPQAQPQPQSVPVLLQQPPHQSGIQPVPVQPSPASLSQPVQQQPQPAVSMVGFIFQNIISWNVLTYLRIYVYRFRCRIHPSFRYSRLLSCPLKYSPCQFCLSVLRLFNNNSNNRLT